MKKILSLLFATLVSLTVFGQVTEITSSSTDNFTYDGATLHHYGVGFHNYFDEQDGGNLYGAGFFGIDLFTGGSHRFRISRYGNVGIGTNNPKSKFVVADGINALSINPGVVNCLGFNRNASDGAIFNPALTAWQFSARTDRFSLEGYNGAEAVSFHVLKNGNVGIGTMAPGTKLDVNGVIRTYNIDNSTANWDNLSMWSDGAKSFIQSNGDESGLFIKSNGGNKIIFESNVGIGIATPTEALEVKGYAKVGCVSIGGEGLTESPRNWVNLGSNGHGTLLLSSNLFLNNGNLFIGKGHSTMSGAAIKIPGNLQTRQNFIEFWTTPVANVVDGGAYAQATPRMIISPDGNVGIGSVNPDAKLTVNGTIHATEVKVDIAVPADYVFDPSYNLKPLSEVETFVKAEKHLPEIPSAAEIKANGSNIGEMQNKLLQKVEELTLYAIEQQKLLANQQAQIEELKKMVGENKPATK